MLHKEQLDVTARGGCQSPHCSHDHSEGLDLAQRCHIGSGSRITQDQNGGVAVECARCLRPVVAVACANRSGRTRSFAAPCHPDAPVVASYVGGSGKLKIACFECRKTIEELDVYASEKH